MRFFVLEKDYFRLATFFFLAGAFFVAFLATFFFFAGMLFVYYLLFPVDKK
jgi:hypothetical protein